MNVQPKVSIAIVTWNNAKEIGECLEPLESLPENWEVWVADNASSDETLKIINERFPFVKTIANKENLGFAEACNKIANATNGEYILFLNPDCLAKPEELEKSLGEIVKNKDIGVLGIKLTDENGVLQKTSHTFPSVFKSLLGNFGFYRFISAEKKRDWFLGDFFDHEDSRAVEWLYGAYMLTRRAAFERAGGIPEDYFLFAEDIDFCYKIRQADFKVWFYAGAEIVHKGNQSAGQMPSLWRTERTIFSKYAFCFNRYGPVKTRIIQLSDLIGNYTEFLIAKLRQPDSPFIKEAKMYRKFIIKALKSTKAEIFRVLKERPEDN